MAGLVTQGSAVSDLGNSLSFVIAGSCLRSQGRTAARQASPAMTNERVCHTLSAVIERMPTRTNLRSFPRKRESSKPMMALQFGSLGPRFRGDERGLVRACHHTHRHAWLAAVHLTIFLRYVFLGASRPRYRGVSDQRLQTRGGKRWPGSCASEMRCKGPAVQAAKRPGASTLRRGP